MQHQDTFKNTTVSSSSLEHTCAKYYNRSYERDEEEEEEKEKRKVVLLSISFSHGSTPAKICKARFCSSEGTLQMLVS